MNLRKISTESIVIAFFTLTLLFFAPLQVYFQNSTQFIFTTQNLLIFYLGIIEIIGFICVSLVVKLLKRRKQIASQKIIVCLLMIGFLVWVQGNLLLWKYPPLDGRGIDWTANIRYGLIDSGIWTMGIILALTLFNFFYRVSKSASIVLITMQLLSVIFYGFSAPTESYFKKYTQDPKAAFSLSKEKKNVAILVLDTFQTDAFQKIIDGNKSYKDMLDGFTYFRNTLGGFPATYLSLPLIMTGKYYDNSITVQEFIKDTYLSNSIPKFMKENGCDVYVDFYANESTSSHVIKRTTVQLNEIYKLSLFKYLPHFIKKVAENNLLGIQEQNSGFIKEMGKNFNTSNTQCTFRFYHMLGLHSPLVLADENNEMKLVPFNRENYDKQAIVVLDIVKQFLNYIKESKIYDNSMILIMGDHGTHLEIENLPREYSNTSELSAPIKITEALPLLLIKRFNSKGPMTISDVPATLGDIAQTIATEFNQKDQLPGESVFNLTKDQKRDRRFFYYNYRENSDEKEYLPPMKEYTVDGFSWLENSWQSTYTTFTKDGKQYNPPQTYKFNSVLTFSYKGRNVVPYLGDGWDSKEEGEWMWTTTKNAYITLPLESIPTDKLLLKANIMPFVFNDKLPSQSVNIYINNNKIGAWLVKEAGEFEVKIPKALIKTPILKIRFDLPNATSPSDIKAGNDGRELGLGVFSMEIKQN